jgi:hypothetical protein
MSRGIYSHRKQDKLIQLDTPKILVITITVVIFFVIPVQIISFLKQNPEELRKLLKPKEETVQTSATQSVNLQNSNEKSEPGRVAGVSTSASKDGFLEEVMGNINLADRSTQYSLLGGFFISISIFSLIYLLSTEKKPKKKHHYQKNRFEYI